MADHPARTLSDLLPRLERLMGRIESLVTAITEGRIGRTGQIGRTGRTGRTGESEDVFTGTIAFRWGKRGGKGCLEPIVHPDLVDLVDLFGL
ncbi:MAG: hypothetical protein OXO51_16595, partial [Gemmatimonadota bacterium]|nr:hypothetical protein [Gemmatimonadota bacterium]